MLRGQTLSFLALGFGGGFLCGEALGFGGGGVLRREGFSGKSFGGEARRFRGSGLFLGEALGFGGGLLPGQTLSLLALSFCGFGGDPRRFGSCGRSALRLGGRVRSVFLVAPSSFAPYIFKRHDLGLVGRVQRLRGGGLLRGAVGLELSLGSGELSGIALAALGIAGCPLGLLRRVLGLLRRHRLDRRLARLGGVEQALVGRGRAEQGRQRRRDAVQGSLDLLVGLRGQGLEGPVLAQGLGDQARHVAGAGLLRLRGDLDGRGEGGSQPGGHGQRLGLLGTLECLLDLEQAGTHQGVHDLPGLEQREAALAGELGDRALPVDLAQQRPRLGVDGHLGVALPGGGQQRYGVRPVQDLVDRLPQLVPLSDLDEQLLDRGRRGDVFASPLVDAELPRSGGPAQQIAGLLADLLVDEGLDDGLVDVPEVDQKLTEPPALELGALGLQRLREGLRAEGAAGHQASAELRPPAGHLDGVHLPAAQVHLGRTAHAVVDVQAA